MHDTRNGGEYVSDRREIGEICLESSHWTESVPDATIRDQHGGNRQFARGAPFCKGRPVSCGVSFLGLSDR